jgi:hypothetical protein
MALVGMGNALAQDTVRTAAPSNASMVGRADMSQTSPNRRD